MRIGRWWLISAGVVLALIQAALIVLWWKLPLWAPQWTAQHAPTPEMAIRAIHQDGQDGLDVYRLVEARALAWGTALGPALLHRFGDSSPEQRMYIVALGGEAARALTELTPDAASVRWQGQFFSTADIRALREDLYELVILAVADGSPYVPHYAAELASALHDQRVVPPFCAFLHGQKTPIGEDLEPVVRMLGVMADARAVPALIPLLSIRHKAHPVVEEALAKCLDDASVEHVVAATRHEHEVVRTWAARQFPHYRASAEFTERITALIGDHERQVSVAAIRAIAETRLTTAGNELLRLAQRDGDPEPRRVAIEALGILAHIPAGSYLRTLMQMPGDPLRGPAITALAALDDQSDTSLLIPLLRETEPDIARLVRAALEQRPLTAEQRQQLDETK